MAITMTEAAQHAHGLRTELSRRGTHHEVLRYCPQEILERNAFHACLEATKSVATRVRALTSEVSDGAPLVEASLAVGTGPDPRVRINGFAAASERSEQHGFANLCGAVGRRRLRHVGSQSERSAKGAIGDHWFSRWGGLGSWPGG
jgi:uncharacterized protein (TIGR02391 family)